MVKGVKPFQVQSGPVLISLNIWRVSVSSLFAWGESLGTTTIYHNNYHYHYHDHDHYTYNEPV